MQVSVAAESDYITERDKPMPSLGHGIIQANLIFEIRNRYPEKFKIISELSLDLGKLYVPDIAAYPWFEFEMSEDTSFYSVPPELTIEILSPKQNVNELIEKSTFFLQKGVKSAWIVIPAMKAIAVYHQPGTYQFFKSNDVLADDVLNIQLPLSGLFS